VDVLVITISITSPTNGSNISRPVTMVEGTMVNPLGLEVGINVNGVVALVEGNRFVANHVPLEQGENTILAMATSSEGHTASASITVNADTTGDYVRVKADPESGIPPFETTLSIQATFSFSTSSLAYTGPGTVQIVSNPTPNEYTVAMTTPGLYVFTVQVTDGQSNEYTATIAVLVMNQAALDGILRAKWNAMKNALAVGDITNATTYISTGAKEMYHYNFTLMNSYLGEIAAGLQDIGEIQIGDRFAEYEMWAEQEGQTYSFYVLFAKDEDGLWKIHFF
jgi:hypothetical protein